MASTSPLLRPPQINIGVMQLATPHVLIHHGQFKGSVSAVAKGPAWGNRDCLPYRQLCQLLRCPCILLKYDHGPKHLAALHLVESFFDLIEGDGLGYEAVEIEPPLEIQVYYHREVPGGKAIAIP